jgi:hypothetical protein
MTIQPRRFPAMLIGLVFLGFGAMKVLDPAGFAIDIRNYRVLPWTGCVVLALYLPWLEVLCGLGLMLHRAYRGALVLAAGMLGVFIVAYGSTRVRGLDVACGCFGHGTASFHWPVLIMDPGLLAIVIYLLRADLRPLSPVIRGGGVVNGPG